MGLISVDYQRADNQICISEFPNKNEAFAFHNNIAAELSPDSSINKVDATWRGFKKDFPEVKSSQFHFNGRIFLPLSNGVDSERINEMVGKIQKLVNSSPLATV